MWTGSGVVAEIGSQRLLQVPTVQNDEMIQTLPTYRSDQSLGVSVLPGALRRCQHLRDTHRLQTLPYLDSINAIPIANQITRCFAIGECLAICCATQAEVGCSVTLKWSTSRRRCSSTKNTNSTLSRMVGTVKKSTDTV